MNGLVKLMTSGPFDAAYVVTFVNNNRTVAAYWCHADKCSISLRGRKNIVL